MLLILTLAPYSRAIKTLEKPEDLKTAWDSGCDFKIAKGPYCSNRNVKELVEQFGDDTGLTVMLYGRSAKGQFQYPITINE